jgi:hypothetical protein
MQRRQAGGQALCSMGCIAAREVVVATDDGNWTPLSNEPSALTQTVTSRAVIIMYDITSLLPPVTEGGNGSV